MSNRPAALAADATLLFITFVWGFTFVAVKDAVTRAPVFLFLAVRFGLAALTLALLAARAAEPGTGRGDGPGVNGLTRARARYQGVAAGLLLFAGYALQTTGLQYTAPGRAGFITGLSVVLVPLVAAVAFKERPGRGVLAGVLLGAAGMGLLFLEPTELTVRTGDLLVLGGALGFAGHVAVIGYWGRALPRLRFTRDQTVTVALLSAAVALAVAPTGPVAWGWQLGATWLVTGPLVSGVLLLAQVWAQQYTSAAHAAVLFAMEPVFAAFAGVALVGEVITWKAALGAGLILVGMLAAEWGRLVTAARRPATPPGSSPVPGRARPSGS